MACALDACDKPIPKPGLREWCDILSASFTRAGFFPVTLLPRQRGRRPFWGAAGVRLSVALIAGSHHVKGWESCCAAFDSRCDAGCRCTGMGNRTFLCSLAARGKRVEPLYFDWKLQL